MNENQPKEKPNERCPCCDRKIRYFGDYPLMQILSVSITKPEEIKVPEVIHDLGQWEENLAENPRKSMFGFKKETAVPAEVAAYFAAHPDEHEYVHSDDYAYQLVSTGLWRRIKNISGSVKEGIIRNYPALKKRLIPLEEMVGKTVPTKEFLDKIKDESEINGMYILFNEGEPGEGCRTLKFTLGNNPSDMGRLHREVLYDIVLDNLATVKYIGRMLRQNPSGFNTF